MKSSIILLSTNNWSLIDKENGEHKAGLSIEYITRDGMINDAHKKGYFSVKESISLDQQQFITEVPGEYEAEYTMVLKDRKPTLKIQSMKFVKPFKI